MMVVEPEVVLVGPGMVLVESGMVAVEPEVVLVGPGVVVVELEVSGVSVTSVALEWRRPYIKAMQTIDGSHFISNLICDMSIIVYHLLKSCRTSI